MNLPTKSLYPLTNADRDGLCLEVDDVERLVFDEQANPYVAWLMALDMEGEGLPHVLGLPKSQCERYLSNDRVSPPPSDVKIFCEKLGIHPAYLQPSLREEGFQYYSDPSILRAVADVLKDPRASAEDRERSLSALKVERKKFEDFEVLHPGLSALLRSAHTKAQTSSPIAIEPSGCAAQFDRAATPRAHDMPVALEDYREFLAKEFDVLEEMRFDKEVIASYMADDLTILGESMEGYSRERFDNLVYDIEKATRLSGTVFRDFSGAVNDAGFQVRKDMNSGDGKRFMKLLPRYIEERHQAARLAAAQKCVQVDIHKFDVLMHHRDLQILAIPLFENYLLANAAIEKYESRQHIPQGSLIDVHWPLD